MTLKRIHKKTENSEFRLYPGLRKGIEIVYAETDENEELIGLKDNWGLTSEIIWLSPDIYYTLQYFDGMHSHMDIQQAYKKKFGDFLFKKTLDDLINVLDEHYFLDNSRSERQIQELNKAYSLQPYRYPKHAGVCYSDDPQQLSKQIDQYGKEMPVNRTLVNSVFNLDIRAAIIPHIDIRLGGGVYANVYKILSQARPADVYIIFGIAHRGLKNLLTLSNKDFKTPFGIVKTDDEIIDFIRSDCAFDVFADEWSHGYEHSIEFQTIFLQHYIDSRFKIVPVLTSFPHMIFQNENSLDYSNFRGFVRAIQSAVKKSGKKVCFIASVDFAHVGPAYGGPENMTSKFRVKVEQNDKLILDALSRRDIESFHQLIAEYDNPYRICGYSALVTMLNCLQDGENGECLAYANATMDDQISLVTFAGMIYK